MAATLAAAHALAVSAAAPTTSASARASDPLAETAAVPAVRQLVVVLHGKRAADRAIYRSVRKLKKEGHQVSVRVTYDAGDAEVHVRETLQLCRGAPLTIVAAGGDGTLNEVVSALVKYDAPVTVTLALLPLGTANDFAAANGISQHPETALRLALDLRKARAIDVGLLNGQAFVNTAGAGVGCGVDDEERVDPLKFLLGKFAIMVKGIAKLFGRQARPFDDVMLRLPLPPETPETSDLFEDDAQMAEMSARPVAGAAEGGRVFEGRVRLLFALAGNSRQVARSLNVCPHALLDDGKLDVLLLCGSLQEHVLGILADVIVRGARRARGRLTCVRVPWLELHCARPLPANRDGEPTPESCSVRFEVLPKRLKMHLPDQRLLMAGQSVRRVRARSAFDLMRRPGTLPRMIFGIQAAPWSFRRKLGGFLTGVGRVLPMAAACALSGYVLAVRRERSQRRAAA